MGEACSVHEKYYKYINISVGETEGKIQFFRRRCRLEDVNNKFKETGGNDVDSSYSRQEIAQSVWRWATGWTIGVLGFDSRRGLRIFFFTTTSRTALGPTQPPIQLVPGALSLGVKRPGREADHSPPSSAKVKEWVELYLHSPHTPSWRGAQLKKAQGQLYSLLRAHP
jgi:hypothetical protein